MCGILRQWSFTGWGLSRHLSFVLSPYSTFTASNLLVPLIFLSLRAATWPWHITRNVPYRLMRGGLGLCEAQSSLPVC